MSNPGEGGSHRRRLGQEAGKLLAGTAGLAAVYFVAGRLGLLAPIVHDHVTLLWAPTGIALAAVLLFGLRAVPGILIGAFLVNFTIGGPAAGAAGVAAGNTLEAAVGAWLLRRAGFRVSLERVRDVLLLLGLGVVAGPAISAAIGVASLTASGQISGDLNPLNLASYWWLGDAMGALLVTPVILTWARLPRPWSIRRERLLEVILLVTGFLVVSDFTLGTWTTNPILHPPLAFTLFPFLAWAGIRFGPRGAATATLLAAAISIWATLEGRAPFARGTLEERLMFHHTYMALASITSLLLAAVFAEAQAASEAKDRFLASLSHELRTPLTPVLAVVSALEGDERVHPNLRRPLDLVRRNVELEARLIDDLLDLTRIVRGKLELRPEVIDARRVIEHTVEICCRGETAGGLWVVTDLAAEDHRIWADPSRLTQVLWNLLSNAVKFTPAGGTITVRSWNEGDRLVLQVSDTGVGIDPGALPQVFDAFEQGRARSPRGVGGLGLGLAISKAIVELHGGRLTAESRGRGQGATFTVSLPSSLPRVDQETGEIEIAGEPVATPEPAPGPLRILLVEDHADTAEAMAELLSLLGYQVTTASTVAEGLAVASAEKFDLMLSDLGLPDGSGLDLMRELASRNGLPGIALSGYGMEDDVRESLEAGFRKHLTKPVTLQQLESAIREVVG
ncbi:MAG TPA: MASE1 domain-containing protein [Thermoanaerobaculia bacterium]|jgi:signal transduction histidine kinase/CheY-like chemotaxis protein|nr:MASE1 domain-containing protein [Thermoanaerobaculia bacterium]